LCPGTCRILSARRARFHGRDRPIPAVVDAPPISRHHDRIPGCGRNGRTAELSRRATHAHHCRPGQTAHTRSDARIECFPAHATFPKWPEGQHPPCHFRGPDRASHALGVTRSLSSPRLPLSRDWPVNDHRATIPDAAQMEPLGFETANEISLSSANYPAGEPEHRT